MDMAPGRGGARPPRGRPPALLPAGGSEIGPAGPIMDGMDRRTGERMREGGGFGRDGRGNGGGDGEFGPGVGVGLDVLCAAVC